LKNAIHNITVTLKSKENFYVLSYQMPREERGMLERRHVPINQLPEGQKEGIGLNEAQRVPHHKSGERECDVVGHYRKKCKMEVTAYYL
jgi:hypothetical protein